jgi:hypothetical protein
LNLFPAENGFKCPHSFAYIVGGSLDVVRRRSAHVRVSQV